jgi:sensor histidine kinase YesM
MKKFLNYLQIDKFFFLFIFLLSYLFVINDRISAGQKIEMVFLPDGPILFFLSTLVIFGVIKLTINYLFSRDEKEANTIKTYLSYFAGAFALYIIVANAFSFLISTLFDTVSRNFNLQTFILNNVSRSVEFILFGGLFLAYLYFKQNNAYRTEINEYDKALASSRIHQLKAQLNPHFLFNNLNTLDQLIEEDKDKASNFLNHFSELYRYSLITSESKTVSIQKEIEFAKSYFKLMEEKYSGYYFLEVIQNDPIADKQVPPFCLQVLIENAIEHNLGTTENPVFITVTIDKSIVVSNNKILKKHKKTTGGRALKNLSNQFLLLGTSAITVKDDDAFFTITLPFVNPNADV